MPEPWVYQVLADAVLALHAAVVVFVVAGLALVVIGNLRRWRWVNGWWFRGLHLGAIGIVVAEAWWGVTCPLTTLEMALRQRAHATTYGGSFIEHWVSRLLYHDAPPWVFIVAYTLFGLLVAAAWWIFPPRRNAPPTIGPPGRSECEPPKRTHGP